MTRRIRKRLSCDRDGHRLENECASVKAIKLVKVFGGNTYLVETMGWRLLQ